MGVIHFDHLPQWRWTVEGWRWQPLFSNVRRWHRLPMGVFHRSAQFAEAVSISNRRLVLLFVRIRRILLKNTVGENFIRWSRLPAGDDNTDSGGPPLGFVKTSRVGLGSAILGHAERKQRRGPGWAGQPWAGPHTRKGKGRMGWAGSRVNWVSAHYRIGVRKILLFFKSSL
jgi:hypothetical protein